MRWWGRFLPLVLLTLVMLLSGGQNSQNLVHASPSDDSEESQPNSAAVNAASHVNPPEAQETTPATGQHKSDAEDGLTTYDIWSLAAQYLIFLATLIYAGVAIYQLNAIHRQADIAAKSAEAAMQSVEAARLMLRLGRPILVVKTIVQENDNWREDEVCEAVVTVENVGQRPAVILKASVGFVMLETNRWLRPLRAPLYDWGDQCNISAPVVVANAESSFRPFLGMWKLKWDPPEDSDVYRVAFAEVKSGEKILSIYGIVYYRDAAMQNTGVEDTYQTAFLWHFGHRGNWPKVGGFYVGGGAFQHST
jgi:hypothetical protein